MRAIINWVYSIFFEWASGHIKGIFYWWIFATCIEIFNILGFVDAIFVFMKLHEIYNVLNWVLDWVWGIYTIFFGISLISWFVRKMLS